MTRALALFAMVLSGCVLFRPSPTPTCVTRCGLYLWPPAPAAATCDWLQAVEDQAISAYDPIWSNVCHFLIREGVIFFPAAEVIDGGTTLSDGRRVAGVTYDVTATVHLATPEALCHELAHVLEYRTNEIPATEHGDWAERGIWQAVERCRNTTTMVKP